MREFIRKFKELDTWTKVIYIYTVLFVVFILTLMINDIVGGDITFGGSSSDCEWGITSGSCN